MAFRKYKDLYGKALEHDWMICSYFIIISRLASSFTLDERELVSRARHSDSPVHCYMLQCMSVYSYVHWPCPWSNLGLHDFRGPTNVKITSPPNFDPTLREAFRYSNFWLMKSLFLCSLITLNFFLSFFSLQPEFKSQIESQTFAGYYPKTWERAPDKHVTFSRNCACVVRKEDSAPHAKQ